MKCAEFVQAYQEACAALDATRDSICFFDRAESHAEKPVETLSRLIEAVKQGRGLGTALTDFLAQALPQHHSANKMRESQAFLTWAIEHLALETISMGARQCEIYSAKQRAVSGVLNAPTPFAACDTFRRYVESLSHQLTFIFNQRENKIVRIVSQLVETRGPASVTIKDLAEALHLSTGHLSRTFRQTGMTLEGFLIQQRVEPGQENVIGSQAERR